MKVTAPYTNDDLTFCVKRSSQYPGYLNAMRILTPTLWVFIFAFGIFNAGILYVAMRFSSNDKKYDYFYILLLIVNRLHLGQALEIKIHRPWLRIFLVSVSLVNVLFFGCVFSYLDYRLSHPYRAKQIQETKVLFDTKFSIKTDSKNLERIKLFAIVRI